MTELVGKALLGSYYVQVIEEQADFDVDIPTHKVEKGIDLTDHVERAPIEISLSGNLIRPTKERVEQLITKLYEYEKKGTPITYHGRRIYKNMLLHGLSIKANAKISNGFSFSCKLTEVRIAQSSYVAPKTKAVTSKVASAGQKQTENKKTTNIYHLVKKGDTYSSLAKKYGTTISQLQKWNNYDARKIPIGVKLRVG